MTPEQLRTVLVEAVAETTRCAQQPEGAVLRRADARTPGHWHSTIALRAAAQSGGDPLEVADHIAEVVRAHPDIAAVTVTGPGFLGIEVRAASLLAAVTALIADPEPSSDPERSDVPESRDADRVPAVRAPNEAESTVWGVDAQLSRRAVDANPAYLLMRTHAHTRRLHRRAVAAGLPVAAPDAAAEQLDAVDRSLLVHIIDTPATADRAVTAGDLRTLIAALDELSRAYLAWTGDHEIVPTLDHDFTGLHAARLRLVVGVTTVLARGLRQLGAPAPERM
ncbi:DALR anticodon-binding domain-containing protein [Brevibacterium metallidurans]|uniref:DALR anticodon-binding domain-containing protein n=1 Tax=Brevibacterium metallidurans TaxID=1482676 RepID=UPI0030DB51DB